MSDAPGGPDWFQASDGKWYPPANQTAAQKKRPGCLKTLLIGFGLFCLLVVIIAVAAGGSASKKDKEAEKTSSTTCAGKTYPDQQKKDICADANNTITLNGMTVTAEPFKSVDTYGNKSLCSNVTIKNGTSKSQDYNVFDFKVQTPSGNVDSTSSAAVGQTLDSGSLIAGATKTGSVCTDDKGEKGQYVLVYKPGWFSSARGTWLFTV